MHRAADDGVSVCLTRLECSSLPIGGEAAAVCALVSLLRKSRRLETLSIGDSELSSESAAAVLQAAADAATGCLTAVNCEDVPIGGDARAVAGLCALLRKSPRLRELRLDGTDL